jgi:uncharacterized RDD family membrane protein YckC
MRQTSWIDDLVREHPTLRQAGWGARAVGLLWFAAALVCVIIGLAIENATDPNAGISELARELAEEGDYVGAVLEEKRRDDKRPFIVGGIALLLAVRCVRRGLRLVQEPGIRALRESPRSPILYLRPFQEDGGHRVGLGRGWGRVLGWVWMPGLTLEEVVAARLRRWGPVVAIGKPAERIPPLGASRLYCGDEDWKSVAESLIVRAQCVVMMVGATRGIEDEIRMLVRRSALSKTLLFVPSCSEQLADARWEHAARVLDEEADLGVGESGIDEDTVFIRFRRGDKERVEHYIARGRRESRDIVWSRAEVTDAVDQAFAGMLAERAASTKGGTRRTDTGAVSGRSGADAPAFDLQDLRARYPRRAVAVVVDLVLAVLVVATCGRLAQAAGEGVKLGVAYGIPFVLHAFLVVSGGSLGQRLLGVAVVNLHGTPPSVLQAATRPLLLWTWIGGYLLPAATRERLSPVDFITRTRVLRRRRLLNALRSGTVGAGKRV